MSVGLLSTITFLIALLAMAYYTLLERKFLAHAQLRKGPSKVGIIGLPQPLADAVKLFLKQRVMPRKANQLGFTLAPALGLTLAMVLWLLKPHFHRATIIPFGRILFLVVSRLRVYAILMAG